LSDMRDVLH